MKARLLVNIITLIMLLSIAAVAAPKETIVFWYGATQDERAAYEQMIKDFERQNPDIKVNAMLVPQSYVEKKLILSVAGNVPPDVVRFYAHLGGELMSRGALERVDTLARRDKLDLSDFYPAGRKQNTYNSRLYGIPWILSPNALFYNKQAFRDAGLDPNKPPKTWAQLEHYAMKLTKRDAKGNLEKVGFADFLYNPNNFSLYLWQTGGDILNKDGRTPAFNNAKGRETLAWMKSFLTREAGSVKDLQVFSSNFKGATQDPFGQGLLAMRIDSPFRIPDLKKYFPKLDYGITAIPYNKYQASEVVGNSLVIPKGSKHLEAAWKFVKFASSREQMMRICKVAGRIPARKSAAQSHEFDALRPFVEQIPYGHSIPVVAGWQESADAIARAFDKGLKGETSVDDTLNIAAASVSSILADANEDMSKYPLVPWKAIGIVAATLLAFACAGLHIFVRHRTRHSKREWNEARQFYLFALPWILGFMIFTFGSTVASLVISFSKWDAITPAHFIGFKNYSRIFTHDPRFYKSIIVTLYYAIFSIPLAMIGGLSVSVMMNQKIMGIRLFRTLYYLPAVISGVATAIMWQFIFNPTNGILNKFLMLNVVPWFSNGHFSLQPLWTTPPQWLVDPKWAMPAFILMGLWTVGGSMIIYLAALQGVPEELYEAARIDGAGSWRTFLSVTLPLLTPAIFYQLIMGTIYSLQMFFQPYIMTGGGPEDSTLMYGLYLYKNAFEWVKMGYASSMAWLLLIVVLAITIIQFKTASRWVYYEGKKEQ